MMGPERNVPVKQSGFFSFKLKIMPKQHGNVPMQGTIGNMTYYVSKDGFLVRGKGTMNGDRIANDKAFERTRENMSEFGRAGKAGKVLRNSLVSLLQNASDRRMIGRLTKEFVKVIKEDAVNNRGLRNVIDGETELLTGFEFNEGGKLGTTLKQPFSTSLNRITGELGISIPSFIPTEAISAPSGTTHFKLVSAGVDIDFEKETFVANLNASAAILLDAAATAPINLVNTVTANSTHPLFLVLGIQFFQGVKNGTMVPLKSGAFNALTIVGVSGV
jgi:hypothetical protein